MAPLLPSWQMFLTVATKMPYTKIMKMMSTKLLIVWVGTKAKLKIRKRKA